MMQLPFTRAQFFEAFASYNHAVWPAQIVALIAALLCVALLFRPGAAAGRATSLALASLWAWAGLVYHWGFFTRINPAAWVFGGLFLAQALLFAWSGVATTRLRFSPIRGLRSATGVVLVGFALLAYPAIGYLIGERYPAAPTFGLPCPITLFTLGMLSFAQPPVPRVVFLVPLLWSAVGALAAFQLGVYQDLALLAAGAVAAVGFFQPPGAPG